MRTRETRLERFTLYTVLIACCVILLLAVGLSLIQFAQRDITRTRCITASTTYALIANVLRNDQRAYKLIAGEIPTSKVQSVITSLASEDDRLLRALDRQMDPRGALLVLNQTGAAYIKSLGVHAYSCDRAVPLITPFSLVQTFPKLRFH